MRIVHVPFCYWPDAIGGTEVYVDSLAREQQRQGCEVVIAAPGTIEDSYKHNELAVRRFPVTPAVQNVRELYGEGDPIAAQAFARILDNETPDLVHLHAFTRGVSLRLVREARRRDLPVIFSYHTPTVSCQRGTLLRWGSQVCDGALDVTECAQCALHGLGLRKFGSLLVGSLPGGVGRALDALGASGGFWTAMRMSELVTLRHGAFRSLVAEVDHIVALCEWVKDLLVRNGVPREKVTVSRQGLDTWEEGCSSRAVKRAGAGPVRIAFLGRLDPTKGVHLLIRALKAKPELNVQLDVMGISQGPAGEEYFQHLKSLARNDRRVTFRPPILSGEVLGRLREYNLLAAPSQCLETGPRVILEAFAAGIPVVGSNLGGIAELVNHGINGMLVDSGSVEAWANSLQVICDDCTILPRLRSGIRFPRTVRTVAAQTQEIYSRTLVSGPPALEDNLSGPDELTVPARLSD